jgi:hypothetical protein
MNGAAVPAHDFRTDPQPQASPGISLGADKRFEERISDSGTNAGSGITDGHANSRPRSIPVFARTGNAVFQHTAVPNGVEGIGDQPETTALVQASSLARIV